MLHVTLHTPQTTGMWRCKMPQRSDEGGFVDWANMARWLLLSTPTSIQNAFGRAVIVACGMMQCAKSKGCEADLMGWARGWPICQAAKSRQAVPSKPGCQDVGRFLLGARPYGDYSRQGAGSGVDQMKALQGPKKKSDLALTFGGWVSGRRSPDNQPLSTILKREPSHHDQASWHHASVTSSSDRYERLIARVLHNPFPLPFSLLHFRSSRHMIHCREFTRAYDFCISSLMHYRST
jgi:hypothetical protein